MCKSVFCQLWSAHCGLYRLLFPNSLCAQWKIRWKSLLIGENVKSGWGQSKVLACCRWILLFSPLGHGWCNYWKPKVMTIKNPSVLIQKPKQIFLLAALASRLVLFSHCFFLKLGSPSLRTFATQIVILGILRVVSVPQVTCRNHFFPSQLYAWSVTVPESSSQTCFSSGGSLLHSLPNILVISGKGTSGRSARSCSRLSFMKRT